MPLAPGDGYKEGIMANETLDPQKDNKDAKSGEPVQLDKEQEKGQPQQEPPQHQQGGKQQEGGPKR
jgi:hypothetical protein